MVDIELIKQLREETGISIGECKKALEEGKTVEKGQGDSQGMGQRDGG